MNALPQDFAVRALSREELEAHWMPFTANRHFKNKPRILSHAKGMHYWTADGRQVLDGVSGLWCVNAGHGRKEISQAVATSLEQMDFGPPFQMGHPQAFDLANALTKIAPAGLDHVFFVNSGSEAVDTALKIALQYQRLKGEATRTRLIGRERGYHGVNLGGTTLGGMVANRKAWGPAMIPGVDHLPHTHNLAKNA
ncbi:MAG TPA: aminotransferase class III-fold pyridoxal phosphate-dependent enzyme, partial [Steroidobacteraceae bacterium]|nr:aminotransferase class III-fold pyridoxal phosphate-dependent enzyme [Steroidobacteraceae bacterium]